MHLKRLKVVNSLFSLSLDLLTFLVHSALHVPSAPKLFPNLTLTAKYLIGLTKTEHYIFVIRFTTVV